MIQVSLVYATPDKARWLTLNLPDQATVAQALAQADLDRVWPDVRVDAEHLAVFGQRCGLTQILHQGDRIEILRPLLIDPKQARLIRAKNE